MFVHFSFLRSLHTHTSAPAQAAFGSAAVAAVVSNAAVVDGDVVAAVGSLVDRVAAVDVPAPVAQASAAIAVSGFL